VGIAHSSTFVDERNEMAKGKIKDLVEEILNQFLLENGLELYNIEYVKEAKDWFLRVYIDKTEGSEAEYVCTDDCELVSRFLSEKMDELDPIEQNYYLEISSPGMDRILLKEKDYVRYAGKQVDVNLYQAIDGKKSFSGELVGIVNDNVIIIDEKANRIEIPMNKVAKTKLAVIF
jgi:ribosome maturation factor RimP